MTETLNFVVGSQAAVSSRIALVVLTAISGLTAVAGGIALALGALVPDLATVLSPPVAYLEGSPFATFLVPGFLLALVVGGTQLWALASLLRSAPHRHLVTAIAGFGLLIWIFVQMMYIPFSLLQAAYFAAGLAEIGFVLLALGVFARRADPEPASSRRAQRRADG
jgi:hypothetical protein